MLLGGAGHQVEASVVRVCVNSHRRESSDPHHQSGRVTGCIDGHDRVKLLVLRSITSLLLKGLERF